MLKQITILLLAAFTASASAATPVKRSDLVGAWRCGPTVMHGSGMTITVNQEVTNARDGTYTSLATTVLTAPDRPAAVTMIHRSSGTWELDGDIFKTHVRRVEFLSSSEPSFTKEMGQEVEDDQLAKKSDYESRILEMTGTRLRSIAVNAMYKEAEVESACERK